MVTSPKSQISFLNINHIVICMCNSSNCWFKHPLPSYVWLQFMKDEWKIEYLLFDFELWITYIDEEWSGNLVFLVQQAMTSAYQNKFQALKFYISLEFLVLHTCQDVATMGCGTKDYDLWSKTHVTCNFKWYPHDLGKPTHTLVPCWMSKPLPPRN